MITKELRLTVIGTRSLTLAFRAGFTECELSIAIIFSFVTNEAEDSSHNVPHHHLARLRSHETSAHALHALNELHRFGCSACRHHSQEEVGGCSRA